MLVKEIMQKDVISLRPEDTVAHAVKVFADNNIGGAPVIDEEGNLVGIITNADVFKNLRVKYKEYNIAFPSTGLGMPGIDFRSKTKYQDLRKAYEAMAQTKVKDIMVKKVTTITPDESVEAIVPTLVDKKINRLPVVKDGKVVGLLSRGDIIRALLMG